MADVSHSGLCNAARRWLSGTRQCNVVLSGIASTAEVPDAIGWSTCYREYGSIVVECKISLSDFHANKHKKHGNKLGQWRYFLVPEGLVTAEKVAEIYPGYGLLYLRRGRVSIIQKATENNEPCLHSEVRMLSFALMHAEHNLHWMGCGVDMAVLTKHPMTNAKNAGYSMYHKRPRFGFGVDLPVEPFTFNKGESR